MAGNQNPIYSRVGQIHGPTILNNPVAATGTGYTGADANTYTIFVADDTNGGYIQRIRIKANGTNPANVMRFWICEPGGQLTSTASAPTTPTATISASAGTMTPGTYFMKVQAIDAMGQPGTFSTEISNTVPSTGNNIVWGWTASANAASYRLAIGTAANQEQFVISNVTSTSYTQNTSSWQGILGNQIGTFAGPIGNSSVIYSTDLTLNTSLFGEVSIPSTTASATAATAEIEYPMKFALPPGYRIVAGIGTTTANGYIVTAIGGKY
jgi:hypothetical protein